MGQLQNKPHKYICMFCVEERRYIKAMLITNGCTEGQYGTLGDDRDPQWDRHHKMIETKQKMDRLHYDNENADEDLTND